MKDSKTYRLRVGIALAFVAVVAVGYFTQTGIGNFSGIGFGSITLLCPLGALLAMIAERTLIPMAVLSVIAVLVICIVLGKVFCAWACPVHFMSRKKKGKRGKKGGGSETETFESGARAAVLEGGAPGVVEPDAEYAMAVDKRAVRAANTATDDVLPVPQTSSGTSLLSPCASCANPCGKTKGIKVDSRHGILAAALVSTLIFGFPVFCLVCPIGLTFATVLLVMQLFAFGSTTWTVVVFPLIVLAEVLLLPRWCKNFCPLGAMLSLFSGLNRTFRPRVNKEACLRQSAGAACDRCVQVCPEGINLHDIAAGETTLNDCSKCRACADVCPTHAIAFPLLPAKRERAGVGEGSIVQGESDAGARLGARASHGAPKSPDAQSRPVVETLEGEDEPCPSSQI